MFHHYSQARTTSTRNCRQLFALMAIVLLIRKFVPTNGQETTCTSQNIRWLLKKSQGQAVCSAEVPSQVASVRSNVECGILCKYSGQGCWNFNYYGQYKRCEMLFYKPLNFTIQTQCLHYEVQLFVSLQRNCNSHI